MKHNREKSRYIVYVKTYDLTTKKCLGKETIKTEKTYTSIMSYEELKAIAKNWLQENLSIDELNEFNLLFTFPERDCIHVGDYGIFEIWFNSYETHKKYFFSVDEAFYDS